MDIRPTTDKGAGERWNGGEPSRVGVVFFADRPKAFNG
jgi:hypothetical protein